MAEAIEAALEALPNYVIDAVSVNVTTEMTDHSAYSSQVGIETAQISIAFIGATVQGPQNLLIVESYGPALSSVIEERAADYNNYECGRRGKCDYDSGVCECFECYTGLGCSIQTALM